MTNELVRRYTYRYTPTDSGSEALAEIRLFMQMCHCDMYVRGNCGAMTFAYKKSAIKIQYVRGNGETGEQEVQSLCYDENSCNLYVYGNTDEDTLVFSKETGTITQIPVGTRVIGQEDNTGKFQVTGQFVCNLDAPSAFKAIQRVQNTLSNNAYMRGDNGEKDTEIPFQFQIQSLTMKTGSSDTSIATCTCAEIAKRRDTIDDTDITAILQKASCNLNVRGNSETITG